MKYLKTNLLIEKNRKSVNFNATFSESNLVQFETLLSWYEMTLLTLQKLKYIYNTVEFRLFFQYLPNKIFHFFQK